MNRDDSLEINKTVLEHSETYSEDRIEHIVKDEEYCRRMKHITESEYDRIYCRHGLGHALSVARIAYIMNLEAGYGLEREMIYAAALLHDIGRYSEYEGELSHHEAGARLAAEILQRDGFFEDEIKVITDAIGGHKKKCSEAGSLADVLYRADKLSRNCFLCDAREQCYWDEELKNKTIHR